MDDFLLQWQCEMTLVRPVGSPESSPVPVRSFKFHIMSQFLFLTVFNIHYMTLCEEFVMSILQLHIKPFKRNRTFIGGQKWTPLQCTVALLLQVLFFLIKTISCHFLQL